MPQKRARTWDIFSTTLRCIEYTAKEITALKNLQADITVRLRPKTLPNRAPSVDLSYGL